jgi:sulfoacetaldehyde dehydrogenase
MHDDIDQMYRRARSAFEEIEFWPQDKVDEMVAAVGWELQKEETARTLVKQAMEEGGLGVYEHKVGKQINKVRGALRDMNGVKTCGVVDEDKEKGIKVIAKPIGVVANVVPTTNPTSTPSFVGLNLLKTRNAMIVSPHPRTKRSTYLAVEYGRKGLRKVGAPEDLFLCIEEPTNQKTVDLVARCDFAVATGGAALARIIHSTGTPCQTVSAGNVVSIIDETVDCAEVAHMITISKTLDNASGCSADNAVAIHESIYDEMVKALEAEGGYFCNAQEREKLKGALWPDGRIINKDIVAKPVKHIADLAGISVPDGTKFLMAVGEKIGPEDRFSGEKLSPVLTVWKWNDFDEIIQRVKRIHKFSGLGHSVSIQSRNDDRILKLALMTNVARVCCNMPHAIANSGSWISGLPVTTTLACGTWAGNISSDNVNWRHFLNYTRIAYPLKERVPTDDELFGDYLRKWGRD